MKRNGIMAAGNWILDHVKRIERWPTQGMLVSINGEAKGSGGAPYNVLLNLAKMETGLPLYAAGLIGEDNAGDYIIQELSENHIDKQYMQRTDNAPTSYTDVMTEEQGGARTFFHQRGANSLLDYDFLAQIENTAKIFHLGYLLLLDELDKTDDEYGVRAARALAMLKEKGFHTSVDVVSEEGERFRRVVRPCLPYIDYLILNEIEAGESSERVIRNADGSINTNALRESAADLMDGGISKLIIIHFPEGGFARDAAGNEIFTPSYHITNDEIKGTVGAGDAFCAGALYAIHEGLPLDETLHIANACARFNLLNLTSTAGAVPINTIRTYIKNARIREAIISLD